MIHNETLNIPKKWFTYTHGWVFKCTTMKQVKQT
jgi:hypothetical protein